MNADRGQIADTGSGISAVRRFGIGASDSGQWVKYFDDCRVSPMRPIFSSFLRENRAHLGDYHRLQLDLWNGFECISCLADGRIEYGGALSGKGNRYPEIVVDKRFGYAGN